MHRSVVRSSGVWLVCAIVTAAVAAAGRAAPPLIDASEILPVAAIRPGMKGVGKSVFQGTKIEEFGVTVLGVLERVDFDGDVILVRIDSGPPVASGAGVSQGMSGSPIFIEGKLVGALSFAFPFAREPIAGVTPIAQMVESYLPGAAPPRTLRAGELAPREPLTLDGRRVDRITVAPTARQAGGAGGGPLTMVPLATPIFASGLGGRGLALLNERLAPFGLAAMPGPGRVELPPDQQPRLEPGAAVGVQLVTGDVEVTAIGTVTYVKEGHVLAFGHPMFGLGSLDMPMTTAYVHTVVSSQEMSFKMASPVAVVGAVSQDRAWAIGGKLGQPARLMRAEISVTDRERGTVREYRTQSILHRNLTASLAYALVVSAIASVAPLDDGTTWSELEVRAAGLPPIRRTNVYSHTERLSPIEQLLTDPLAIIPLSDLYFVLDTLENNPYGSVPVESIAVRIRVSERRETARIERVYADRKRVRPGDRVKLGVVLMPFGGERETRELELEIPSNLPGGKIQIGVAGGLSAERMLQTMQIRRPPPRSVDQLLAVIAERPRNQDLTVVTALPVTGVAALGREIPNLPNAVAEVLVSANPAGIRPIRSHTRQVVTTPWAVSGAQLITLEVEADQRDKSGRLRVTGDVPEGGVTALFQLLMLGMLASDDEGDTDVVARRPLGVATQSGPDLASLFGGAAGSETAPGPENETSQLPGQARSWHYRRGEHFRGGRAEGVLVSARGELSLAPVPQRLLSAPERLLWALAMRPGDRLCVAGWLDGRVLAISDDGRQETLLDTGDVAVPAIASDAHGGLYIATLPGGAIHYLPPDGPAREVARLPGEQIWALLVARDGELYAATGPRGRLYRIGRDGGPEVVFTAPDRHVYTLAAGPLGEVYFGTYPMGKIYRRERSGQITPVYEPPDLTITSLAVDGAGNLYAGTSPSARVLRITPGGRATTIFQAPARHVTAVLPRPNGGLIVATGNPGAVYQVEGERAAARWWDPDAAYVLSLVPAANGDLLAVTAGPTTVTRLPMTLAPAAQGTYTSPVLDAGNIARWGVIRWEGTGNVAVRTRTGRTAYPDATWSDWSEPVRTSGSPIASPEGRYLQFQVMLARGAADAPPPRVSALTITYRPRNRAPEVGFKRPRAGEILGGRRPVIWAGRDPDGDRLTYELSYAPEGSDRWVRLLVRQATPPEGETGGVGSPTIAVPSGEPPPLDFDGSGLTPGRTGRLPRAGRIPTARGRPAQSRPGFTLTLPLGGDSEEPQPEPTLDDVLAAVGDDGAGGERFDLLTRILRDGRYRLRIVASDAASCPDESLTAEAISDVFTVDNTPPRIVRSAIRRDGQGIPTAIPVFDATSPIARVRYRLAGEREWRPAAAEDGIFDSPREVARLGSLPPGPGVIEIVATDVAGNIAVGRVTYRPPGAPSRPAPAAPRPRSVPSRR